jgi:signal transduction histidine kinase
MDTETLISPEVLVPRLGEQLVKMGLLNAGQLQQALDYQRECRSAGQQRLLGQAIMDLGFLDRATLDHAVTEQILSLRAALEDANHNLEERVQQRTRELEEALRRLSEMNQLKANIVANVSHELRTPLTHIHGYLELLSTESLGSLNEDQKKAINVSLRSSLRLQHLIDDLILFSQASRGEMTLTLAPLDLEQMVTRIIAEFQLRAEESQLILEVHLQKGLPMVKADEAKLHWVIAQLLENALKFTLPGGKVSLTVAREAADNNLVTIKVADTGIGIPQEHVKEIFEPFHQLDGSATRRYGGTGLGLSLVLQIIEAHGSLVNVGSEINQGTTISFPLLIAKAD